jgi:DNA replication and repair protein RecF
LILARLELTNFRNYRHQDIEFSPHRNLVVGRNAQGKSNLLESIYFLSYLRTKRATRLIDLVRERAEKASVLGLIIDEGRETKVNLTFGRGGRIVEVNGQKMDSGSRAKGILKSVSFDPDDLYLVKGEPVRRREFLDETSAALGPADAGVINEYRHTLRQRNAVLKNWEEYGAGLRAVIEPWNQALASAGAKIVASRLQIMRTMEEVLGKKYSEISGDNKEIGLHYACSFDAEGTSLGQVYERMRKALDSAFGEEKRERSTKVGPHRDDVEIRLDGRESRFRASQGEQRTLAFCMRLAQKEHIERVTGQTPVVLLDDILSELDEGRRGRVLDAVGRKSQAIITTTDVPADVKRASDKVFVVEEGMISIG